MDLVLHHPARFAVQAVRFGSSWTVVAKLTCEIAGGSTFAPTEMPAPLTSADVPGGDDPHAAARYESDFVPFKPRADCLLVGTAHPPGGASAGCVVTFGVGKHFDKSILVVGDRQWVPKLGGLRTGATPPSMFRSMPLTYENAYGGKDMTADDAGAFFAPNPSGKGYAVSGKTAIGRGLPNLEDPARQLRAWSDRVEPRSFGPVGRTWQPRLSRAGTYDERWQRGRAPLPPLDFNERYFNAAPGDQQVEGFLRGDEEVQLTNLHPSRSTIAARLPGVRLRAFVAPASNATTSRWQRPALRELTINLDTLWVDADALRAALVWRARFEPQPGDARVLVVEERVDGPRQPAESFRHEFEQVDAEAAETERAEAEIDQEEPIASLDDDDDPAE